MARAFLRIWNFFMQIQYELLRTTSKPIFESYIWNSRQIKNSWKISPYISKTGIMVKGHFKSGQLDFILYNYSLLQGEGFAKLLGDLVY